MRNWMHFAHTNVDAIHIHKQNRWAWFGLAILWTERCNIMFGYVYLLAKWEPRILSKVFIIWATVGHSYKTDDDIYV